MSNRTQKDWRETESLDDAARRLWRDWDERKAKKAAEGRKRSAQIADQPRSPADKAADGESDRGLGSLDRRPPVAATKGEDCWQRIGNTGGQADFGRGSSLKYKDTARPNSERTSLFTDRTDLEGLMLRRIE